MKLKLLFITFALLVACMNSFGQIISQYVETNSGTTPKGIETWNDTCIANFAFCASVDTYSTNIRTPDFDKTTIRLNGVACQNRTSATTFRTYPWETDLVIGTFSNNDFTFNGTVTQITSPTDYFRSSVSGDWATPSNWESSSDNTNWIPSTLAPDSNSTLITIRSPHTITISSAVTADQIIVETGATLALNGANLTLNDGDGEDLIISSGGTFDNGGENQIINGGGSPSIIIWGKFITRDAQGFVGSNTAIPGITPTLNLGCTIEYGLNGNQAVQGGRSYINLTLSNSGIKRLSSAITNSNMITGTVTIKDAAILDVENKSFGNSDTHLIMTGSSEFKMAGTGVKPDIGGTYSLGIGTKMTFTSGSEALPIATLQQIRLAPNYYNIDIVGNNVGTNSLTSPVKFQTGGTFTVKPTGVFKLSNTSGFSNGSTTAIDNTNNPTITLETGSTIEYAGANQTITPFTNTIAPTPIYTDANKSYYNMTISGTGTKTIATNSEILVGNELSVTGGILQIDSNKLLTVNNAIKNTGGTILVKNSGNLVQLTNVDNATNNANTGNIKMTRTSRDMQNAYDYVYWGSPVKGNIFSQIPSSVYSVSYQWDLTGAKDGAWNLLTTTTPSPGRGFISRVKTGGTGAKDFDFTGIPNNGTVLVAADGYDTDFNLNTTGNTILLANPYPCAIDAEAFVVANGLLDGNLYFWTSLTAITGNTYSDGDYATWNQSGGTSTAANDMSGNDNLKPSGKIAAGQGFFADFHADGNITFTNAMRIRSTGDNSQFFKTTKPNKGYEEKSRVWLNLTNSKKAFRQMLVAYITGATNGFDRSYDAESFSLNEIDIYSIVEDKNLVIQGRALPLEDTDVVPLGVAITNAGAYTISIDEVDGQMTNKPIFIEDKVANVVHNLKNAAYNFNIGSGTFNDRFVLRYTDKILRTNDFDSLENQVLVSYKNKQLKVNSVIENIDTVIVHDLLGRLLFKKEKVNSNEFSLYNWVANQQVVIVKVSLQNGNEVKKKVMF